MFIKHPYRAVFVTAPVFIIASALIFSSKPPGPLIDFNSGMSIDELHRKADLKSLAVAPAYDYF
jgi:hypothetical protein